MLANALALGAPYWVDWEGNDLPENQGWTRQWGNWQGEHQGGAYRTLANGILTYDSLYDNGVYDLADMDRPIDPGPGELFVMEWRLKVDQVVGWPYDPGVYAISDARRGVAFAFGQSALESVYEGHVTIPVSPGNFHEFRLVSWDMTTYELSVDGALARNGAFVPLVNQSHVGWGDLVQGAASLHHWAYFRFGVVPEPASVTLLGAVLACSGGAELRRKVT